MSTTEAEQFDRGMRFFEHWGIQHLRQALLHDVAGIVLEVGAGTGANLPLYGRSAHATLVDIKPDRLLLARQKSGAPHAPATCANAQQLPFADSQFDVVVGTLVFCSIPQPELALAEIRRVLKPDGRLLLLEHTRGHGPISRRFTDWLQPLWFALQGECHLNRETAVTVQQAGFTIDHSSVHGYGLLQMMKASVCPEKV
ncbi:class I SAM-dependent methyltransferase [Candidatus Leptofilum sp.]|uniref:class I SAM-dependent methyltransferase n=1 Tax=Candidatus Leptofilum sp. TaxID=3241576 RepID=UPI003B5ADA7A